MNTFASSDPTIIAGATRSRFYVRVAWVCLAITLVGFLPTYWVPMARGTLEVRPLAYVHALLFYGWMLLFIRQATLAASGKIMRHMEWGVAGVALASAMIVVGLAMAISSIRHFEALGHGPAARAFSFVPVSSMLLFGALIAVAVLNVRKPEIHKRLMLVATVSMLQPAIARWFAVALAPPGPPVPPPIFVSIPPAFLGNLVLVAAMIFDKRTRGQVHPAYWIAGGLLLFVQLVRIPIGPTDAWIAMTYWLVAFSP